MMMMIMVMIIREFSLENLSEKFLVFISKFMVRNERILNLEVDDENLCMFIFSYFFS